MSKKSSAKSFLSISVKTDVTIWNIMVLPFLFGVNTVAGSYANTQLVFILKDSDYFGVPEE